MSTQLPASSVAAARRVTGSCRDFILDRVKFRVVCRGNLEIGLESDTQVGIDNISYRIKTTFLCARLSVQNPGAGTYIVLLPGDMKGLI